MTTERDQIQKAKEDERRKAENSIPEEPFIHIQPWADACEHDFSIWRDFPDGNGGEYVCSSCGMGALHYTLMKGE